MGQDKGQVGASVGDEKTPEDIRREIEETRQDLGDTAAALAAKTDVKARAKEKVDGVKQTIAEKKESFSSSSGDGAGDGGGASAAQARASDAVGQIKTKAQQNPIPTAAIAAFVGGFLFGRLTSR
jgi:ElaB/YqjD/DUF883 family membrane-anchored ribosome-binding protein